VVVRDVLKYVRAQQDVHRIIGVSAHCRKVDPYVDILSTEVSALVGDEGIASKFLV
jgi:hypothetical protein